MFLKQMSLTMADSRAVTITSNPASIPTNEVPPFSTRVTVDPQNALFSHQNDISNQFGLRTANHWIGVIYVNYSENGTK